MRQKTLVAIVFLLILSRIVAFGMEIEKIEKNTQSFLSFRVFRDMERSGSLEVGAQQGFKLLGQNWTGALNLGVSDLGEFEWTAGEQYAYSNLDSTRGNELSTDVGLDWIGRTWNAGLTGGVELRNFGGALSLSQNQYKLMLDLGVHWDWLSVRLAGGWLENRWVGMSGGFVEWHGEGWHLRFPVSYEWLGSELQSGVELLSYRRDFRFGIFYRLGFKDQGGFIFPFEALLERRVGHWEWRLHFAPSDWDDFMGSAEIRYYWFLPKRAFDFYEE